ncbi:MAG: GNAT family N-acetyltransferase [Planctomycetaceae bacterium]|nr:GNAT family N-acetyltransferase [Planctomycetaceae bacterium]
MNTIRQPTRATQVHIRWMIRRDMPEVLEIERESFEFPWSEESFIRCLRERNCIGMVAENGSQDVIGFVVYEMCRDHIDVLNLAVSPWWRRAGVGRQIVDKLKTKISPQRRHYLRGHVRETNLDALQFLKAQGFVATGVIHGYYDHTDDDAIKLVYRADAEGARP